MVSPNSNELLVLLSNFTSLTESKTCGGDNSTIVFENDVASAIISNGCVIIGAVVSSNLIVCVSDAELPDSSVAVQYFRCVVSYR